MKKRAFIIVLDSLGIGNAPDAAAFGDEGSNTLASIAKSAEFRAPVLSRLGLFNIDGVDALPQEADIKGAVARLVERSNGKDTTIGHWEIAGLVSERPLPTYPNGFPPEIIEEFERRTGRKTLCNKPYSGTELLRDYGEEHLRTRALMVYTSADSVFQVAAHEELVPVPTLYEYCQIAREILTGEHAVGRVIARPFVGTDKDDFKRTPNRHDFSLLPPKKTVLDFICEAGKEVIGVGKIYDIFAGKGVTRQLKSKNNSDGMDISERLLCEDFDGLAFINLVDFDMTFGHRNDVDGYARAVSDFDTLLSDFLVNMREQDILIITADHGCDPGTPSTDHSRETVPMIAYGHNIKPVNLGTRHGFCDIAATVAEYLGVKADIEGRSFLSEIIL